MWGEKNNKIKIIKVDSENEQTKLENAEFKITSVADGKEYVVKTTHCKALNRFRFSNAKCADSVNRRMRASGRALLR